MQYIEIELTKEQFNQVKPILKKQQENANDGEPGMVFGNLIFKDKTMSTLENPTTAIFKMGILPNELAWDIVEQTKGKFQKLELIKYFHITADYFVEAKDENEAEQLVKDEINGEFYESHVVIKEASNDDYENIASGRIEVFNSSGEETE